MIYVDANVLIYAATTSAYLHVQAMSRGSRELIVQVARGNVEVTTTEAVLAEVAFVLRSKTHFGLEVPDAAARMAAILTLPGFRFDHKSAVLEALDVWTANPSIDFVDALVVAHGRRLDVEVATYDKHFDRFPDLKRWQPESA